MQKKKFDSENFPDQMDQIFFIINFWKKKKKDTVPYQKEMAYAWTLGAPSLGRAAHSEGGCRSIQQVMESAF